ncbi:hypothetical protein [Mesoterricola sediminis]|nr:hypothetical protein [Mesoterricola sediminis]
MEIRGRNPRTGTCGVRRIVTLAGNRIKYRCVSFDQGDIRATRQRLYTTSVDDFLAWAIRDVTEEPAC